MKIGVRQPGWRVLVSSCDTNCDLWPIFFHFFFKHYPDAPIPVYLMSNFRTYDDPRVKTITVGQDISWGDCIHRMSDVYPYEHVWMLLDDFFLDAKVDSSRVDSYFEDWNNRGGIYLETGTPLSLGDPMEGSPLRKTTATSLVAGINSAFYNVNFLRELAVPGINLWQANSILAQMNREGHEGLYHIDGELLPLIKFVESVKGRFWRVQGLKYLHEQGVHPDWKWRPSPPFGNSWWRKAVRSYYKRRMKSRARSLEKKDSHSPVVISPLDTESLKVRVPC